MLCPLPTLAVAYEHFVLNAGVHGPVLLLLAWLGYSMGMHAIRSRQDAASFTAQVKEARGQGITLLLAQSLSGLITLAGPCGSSTRSASASQSRHSSAPSDRRQRVR